MPVLNYYGKANNSLLNQPSFDFVFEALRQIYQKSEVD